MNAKFLFLLFCFFVQSDTLVQPDLISGNWLAADKKSIIECYKGSDGNYHGKLVWFARKYTDTADVERCALPVRNWIGKTVMSDFKFDGDEWNGGRIEDVRTCKSFDAYIKIEDKNILKASGYMYFRFLNETVVFTRHLSAIPKK